MNENNNNNFVQEIFHDLFSSMEALETQNTAVLQFLKDKGIATDEELASHLEQAGDASSVRWRATRVRLERVFASAAQAEEKAFQAPKAQTPKTPAEQQTSANQQPENAAEKTQSKEHAADGGKTKEDVKKEKGGDETKPETTQERRDGAETPPAKVEDNAA